LQLLSLQSVPSRTVSTQPPTRPIFLSKCLQFGYYRGPADFTSLERALVFRGRAPARIGCSAVLRNPAVKGREPAHVDKHRCCRSVRGVLDFDKRYSTLFKLNGGSFERLLQFVASGALGESAFNGGKKRNDWKWGGFGVACLDSLDKLVGDGWAKPVLPLDTVCLSVPSPCGACSRRIRSVIVSTYRETGIPRIARISWRVLTSRGERGGLSSHFMKSANFTACSTRTSATDTFTTLGPCATPATHSLPRSAARPRATASYSVAAVTSTVCEMPSIS